MDIWTERLRQRHLPILKRWIGRTAGAMTENDFPTDPGQLTQWFEMCAAEPGREDYLVSVYETPVGLAGLRMQDARTAELYLLLCEVNYNLIRTATYASLRMLDRAFLNAERVCARVCTRSREYPDALERMGFCLGPEENGRCCAAVEKETFIQRKYLF